jgi:hypothetical protein
MKEILLMAILVVLVAILASVYFVPDKWDILRHSLEQQSSFPAGRT